MQEPAYARDWQECQQEENKEFLDIHSQKNLNMFPAQPDNTDKAVTTAKMMMDNLVFMP
jgi:hypothetical protein